MKNSIAEQRILLTARISKFSEGQVPSDLLLVARFFDLLEKNYKEERDIEFYAGPLCVSGWRLNYLLRFHLQCSFYAVVQCRVFEEAKKLLEYSSFSIREITFDLGLDNPSYFCRYFKKLTGMSPVAYRKMVLQQVFERTG